VLLAPSQSCRQCAQCLAGLDNYCRQFTVLGYFIDGCQAEYLALPEVYAVPIPGDLTFEEAAAAPLVFLTAWHMLKTRARLQPGEHVLVLGGASGVGTAALQIALLLGARVIATAGGETKLARVRELGAEEVIDHYRQNIGEEVRRLTARRGVDVVFEHVGEATWEHSVASLAHHGRLVTCGATTGAGAKLDLRYLFARQISLLGSFMGTLGELHEVLRFLGARRLRPIIDQILPMREVRAAQERLEKKEHFGKVVLTP
jgi:NADPH:quinone reductase-like Zn-dependent oxidoreductase